MANRKNYTVLVPYPTGGGHWAAKGSTVDLLEVQAHALETAGRIKETALIEAEAAAAAPAAKKNHCEG
ncbi:hypothetical protein LOY64_30045 (plasmid) [Pseudomonas corrugata]|uniref:hypothetical protein n=1 Tax=Pseudomonas corrugata TaxID=47879 RepID=UPI0022303F1A|nr:hypothetical protein [Pseudomonas corrugata]UZD98483.1 hypothetical protein LOY64_30350 [Pseudomonas corrugata]UZD98512.1 hypothetical protein LOY64_30045 [Pseudomonas corrugata]